MPAGATLFGVYVYLSMNVMALGLFSGNSGTTDAGLENLATWGENAGEYRNATVQSFAVASVLGAVIMRRRLERDPFPRRDQAPTGP